MKTLRSSTLLLVALLWTSHAQAILITLEPDNFEVGTVLTNAAPGATISFLSQSGVTTYEPTRSDVVARACPAGSNYCPEEEGSMTFGGSWGWEEYTRCLLYSSPSGCSYGFGVFEIQFDSPTNIFQATFAFLNDGPGLTAFDSFGNVLGTCTAPFGTAYGDCESLLDSGYPGTSRIMFSFESDESDIARVVAGGYPGASTLTQFTYSVPEPGTLWLLGTGLAGLVAARRRRRA